MNRALDLPHGQATFFILFIGFFFYHQSLENGLIPPVLGGYFGVASVVVLALLGPVIIFRIFYGGINSLKLNYFDRYFLIMMFFILAVSGFHYAIGRLAGNTSMLIWSVSGVFFNLTAYSIGRTYEFSERNKHVLLVSAIAMLGIIYFNSVEGKFYVWRAYVDDNATTYQGYGRTLVLVGFLLLAYSRGISGATLTAAAFIPALFLNGGRTELVLFIASCFSFVAYGLLHVRGGLFWLAVFAVSFIGLGMYIAPVLQAVLQLTEVALRTISHNPLFGDYGGYVLSESGVGYYSHNLLSAWVNLGFVGFALYVFIILTGLFFILRAGREAVFRRSARWRMAFFMCVYMTLAYLLSRNYLDELFGFHLGLLAALYQRYSASVKSGSDGVP
jgi:hypothetical protein